MGPYRVPARATIAPMNANPSSLSSLTSSSGGVMPQGEEAASFADRIVIIAGGRLVADGSVDEIRALGDGALVTATWPGISEETLGQHLADCPAASSILHAVVRGEHVELRTTDSDTVARCC